MHRLTETVSRRGVCFFRDQLITGEQMMELSRRMADATGRPKESTLSIHPLESDTAPEVMTGANPQTTTISADRQRKSGGISRMLVFSTSFFLWMLGLISVFSYDDVSRWASTAQHSDITFESFSRICNVHG